MDGGAPQRLSLPVAVAMALLMSATLATAARADDDDDSPHITVRGAASVEVAPDLAVLRLGVEAEDGDAGAALKAAAAALSAVTEAAVAQGIARDDIEPGTVTLERASPEAASSAGAQRPYRAAAGLRVRLHDPAKVASVLAALVAKGVTRVKGVDYRLADPAAQLARVTGMAVADARRRAEAAANAANVKLGPLLSIEPPDEPAGGSRLDRVPGGGAGRGSVSTVVEASFAVVP